MEDELKQLLDERDIINIVNSIGIYADRHNWDKLSQAFAFEVLLDYSSMGAPAEKLKPPEIITRWKALLPGFKMTQHVITNHRVTITGDEAECFSYVVATHYLPNPSAKNIWLVMGYYEHHLIRTSAGWKIDRMKLTATLIDGNTQLPQMAMETVKKMV
ncbi:MAG TPA: nuclear transport factor 2 family protein [Methanosarcina sp.]|nr:nuclear transport factor 2 family protein [Methanosarcina sp.]